MEEERKFKSKDEWKELINKLSPKEFQDLCFDILNNNNFSNVKPRGDGGDGGRDLEGEFMYIFGKEKVTNKCWFQCKRYGTGTALNFKSFSTDVQKAEDQGIDKFIIISNRDLSPDGKTDIENWNKKHKCHISDWTGTLFLNMLFELPSVCRTYFSDDEVPPVVDIKNPELAIEMSSDIGKRYGVNIEMGIPKNVNLANPIEVAGVLKDALLKMQDVDISIKSLIYEKISMLFFSLGQTDDAIAFLNNSLDITPKNISALLTKGYILGEADRLDESNAVYDDLFEIDKNNVLALNSKAFNLYRQGELEEALDLVNRALGLAPKLIIAINTKISILRILKRIDEASEFLSKNEDAFEKSTDLMTEKVYLSIERLDLKEAFRINEDILAKEPDNLLALNNKGLIYGTNSDYQLPQKYIQLARDVFERIIQIKKDNGEAWANKIVALRRETKFSESEKALEIAYSLLPTSPLILHQKGILLIDKKQARQAIKYLDYALKKQYNGECLLNRAVANFEISQYEPALRDLERLLSYEKDNSEAWRLKGECLRRLRRPFWQQAFQNAEKFKIKNPVSLLE